MKKISKIILALIYLALIVFFLINADKFSAESIISYSPSSPVLAALFMLFMFVLKTLSIFFPGAVLQLVSGFLFPLHIALLINCIGCMIEFTIPYIIGYYSGAEAAEKRIRKNEKVSDFLDKQHNHEFFITFFLRVISCLPCDLVSMYFGAMKIRFSTFLIASFLGTLPGIIPITYMGKSIKNPTSPGFRFSVFITVFCSVLSIIIFKVYNKKHYIKEEKPYGK